MYAVRGFGDASTTREIGTGVSVAGSAASAAVPVIGAVVAGVTLLISAFGVGKGCGASCTLSTQVVEQIIPVMQKNLAAAQTQLQANGGCLTSDEQATCLSNFDQLWQAMVNGCNQVGGAGGSQCIADRQRGGKYDCFRDLRDPISAMAVCDSSSAAGIAADLTSNNGLPLLALGLIAAGLLL